MREIKVSSVQNLLVNLLIKHPTMEIIHHHSPRWQQDNQTYMRDRSNGLGHILPAEPYTQTPVARVTLEALTKKKIVCLTNNDPNFEIYALHPNIEKGASLLDDKVVFANVCTS